MPELLVHHWWNDSYRLVDLIDLAHWAHSAASVGVRIVQPNELNNKARAWYTLCGRTGLLPDAGHTTARCTPIAVRGLVRGGTIDDARRAITPVLNRHGFAKVVTLRRIHEPARDHSERMMIRLLMLQAHFLALRMHPRLIELLQMVLDKLPQRFVAVHLRQELDILAISGCIDSTDPRHAAAEKVIMNWGGWHSKPLAGARKMRARFRNSTSAMRDAGKCGVSASAVRELLDAIGTPKGTAVYVCGQREGLESLSTSARYNVWTNMLVLPPAVWTQYQHHASLLALLDVAVSTRASLFISARGNFDRAVLSRRALRGRRSLDSHDAYFGAKRNEASGKVSFSQHVRHAFVSTDLNSRSRPLNAKERYKPYQVYENPMPTAHACGGLLHLTNGLNETHFEHTY